MRAVGDFSIVAVAELGNGMMVRTILYSLPT